LCDAARDCPLSGGRRATSDHGHRSIRDLTNSRAASGRGRATDPGSHRNRPGIVRSGRVGGRFGAAILGR
jgi:hypothetical protein